MGVGAIEHGCANPGAGGEVVAGLELAGGVPDKVEGGFVDGGFDPERGVGGGVDPRGEAGVVEFGAAFETRIRAEDEPEGAVGGSGGGKGGAVLGFEEEGVVLRAIVGFADVAEDGHVRAAEGLVAFVEVHAPPIFAVGEGGGFEGHGAGLENDAFAGRASDADEARGGIGGELDFHGDADGGVRREAGDLFFPKHEKVVAAVAAADEEGGGGAEVLRAGAVVGDEIVERGIEILGVVGEAGGETVVGFGKIERVAESLRGGGCGEAGEGDPEDGDHLAHRRRGNFHPGGVGLGNTHAGEVNGGLGVPVLVGREIGDRGEKKTGGGVSSAGSTNHEIFNQARVATLRRMRQRTNALPRPMRAQVLGSGTGENASPRNA